MTDEVTRATLHFRLLPELDDINREISDLELEQTRLEAARAREARREGALAAVRKAERDAEQAHAANVTLRANDRKTAEEIEEERQSAVRSAASAEDAFAAEYESAFTAQAVRALLDREEFLIDETAAISDEARRFAHFAELGVVASPVAKAAIYHLWDVDAMSQPCRCAHCGIVLLLKKQYIGDQLVEVFCAKCTAEHHRDQLFRDNLELQEFYLKRTFVRIDAEFRRELDALENEEEPMCRREVAVEHELQFKLVVSDRFTAELRAIAAKEEAARVQREEEERAMWEGRGGVAGGGAASSSSSATATGSRTSNRRRHHDWVTMSPEEEERQARRAAKANRAGVRQLGPLSAAGVFY